MTLTMPTLTSQQTVYAAGILHAVTLAAAAYLVLPADPTGRPLAIALTGVAVSAALTYMAAHQVKGAVTAEVKSRVEHPAGPAVPLP